MNLSQAEKVRIYAAARGALRDAARVQAPRVNGSAEVMGEITIEVLAAAGEAAFGESLKVLDEHQISISSLRAG